MSTKKILHGKLVRGNSYTLQGKVFARDKWVSVTEDERAHLETHAYDVITVKDGDRTTADHKSKFVFEEREPEPSKTVLSSKNRSRTRNRTAA